MRSFGRARQHEDGAEALVGGSADIGFHRIADHGGFVGGQAHALASGSHHERVGLTEVVCLFSGGRFEQRDDGIAAGEGALVGGPQASALVEMSPAPKAMQRRITLHIS